MGDPGGHEHPVGRHAVASGPGMQAEDLARDAPLSDTRRPRSRCSLKRCWLSSRTIGRVWSSLAAALLQRAQGLGERPLQPGEVVGLAVMVRRELVGPPDGSVPYVFAGTLDKRSDIADAFRVRHRPAAAAGDVDRRGVGEHPAPPLVEVEVGPERPAGDPRVAVQPQLAINLERPGAVGRRPRDDLAVADDLELAEREDAAGGGAHADRARS